VSVCGSSGYEYANNEFPFIVRRESTLETQGAALAVAWSPDGSKLAAASDYGNTLSVWSRLGKPLVKINRPGEGPEVSGSIAFADDSRELVF
jgi:WD40 repeat protein